MRCQGDGEGGGDGSDDGDGGDGFEDSELEVPILEVSNTYTIL